MTAGTPASPAQQSQGKAACHLLISSAYIHGKVRQVLALDTPTATSLQMLQEIMPFGKGHHAEHPPLGRNTTICSALWL